MHIFALIERAHSLQRHAQAHFDAHDYAQLSCWLLTLANHVVTALAVHVLGGVLGASLERALVARHHRDDSAPKNACAFAHVKQRARLAGESLFAHAYLSTLQAIALAFYLTNAGIWDSARYWHADAAPMPGAARHLYASQLAIYATHLVHVVLDTRLPDRRRMLVHHISTLGLLACSALSGHWRAGVAIMASCDVGDVALQLGRIFKTVYANSAASTASLAVFLVLWSVQRVYWIVWRIIVPRLVWPRAHECCDSAFAWFINALLAALALLVLSWTFEIVRGAWRRLVRGELDTGEQDEAPPLAQPAPALTLTPPP